MMGPSFQQAGSRREFFRAAGRAGFLAALAAAAAVVGTRVARGPQRCVNQGFCRACRVFAACGLPAALSAKAAQKKGEL